MTGWILITGAAKRIGRAIALDLAAQGWNIIVHYHHSAAEAQEVAEEIRKLGREACLAEIDLANPKLAEKLIPSLAEELGMIDALVNNAALFERDADDPDGSRHWAVNADAPRLLSKAFRAHLPPREKGVIVNLLDATPPPHFAAYTRSKQFLAEMTLNMAKSFAPRVRVNGVAPAFVLPGPRQSEEAFRKMAGGKIVTPQQVAEAVRRLIETPTLTGEIATLV
ncbi:MAG: SDR family NAD(P)-dependent oxidoreductase [Alphaproteobacteria bacterium]|nr:SDR family NAD(P)-dependent oxidoreductase [Alphaproteobacteria bacterium]